MPSVISVGIDGSPASHLAVLWGVRRAGQTGASVVLVHACEDATLDPETRALLDDELARAQSIGPGIAVSVRTVTGEPMAALAAAAVDSEMVVIGTDKTGFVRGQVFGSNSLRLAGLSATRVAVIPASSGRSLGGIVVGVSASAGSLGAVDFAAAEASRARKSLTLVAAQSPRVLYVRNGESLETHQPDPTATAALDRAVALVRDRYPDLEFHARVVQRPASQALVDIAARADLFVIGRSRSDADGQPIGRVAHDVLLNLASPTVVVPPALSVAAAR